MHNLLVIFLAVVLYSSASAQSHRLNEKDLRVLEGAKWIGELTYLDYSSNKSTSIPSHLIVTRKAGGATTWVFAYEYAKEPHANSTAEVSLSDDGTKFFGEDVAETKRLPDGSLVITTTKTGTDNDKPALFRYIYQISRSSFSIKKEIKTEGSSTYFERNTYRWTR